MMRAQLQLQLGYSVELEARTLELPLTERRMSLFLILPDYLDPGIHQLEANFTKQHVRALMSTLQVIYRTTYILFNPKDRQQLGVRGHLQMTLQH